MWWRGYCGGEGNESDDKICLDCFWKRSITSLELVFLKWKAKWKIEDWLRDGKRSIKKMSNWRRKRQIKKRKRIIRKISDYKINEGKLNNKIITIRS